MRFLYWNLNRKPIGHLVAALVHEHSVDVLVLSECDVDLPRFMLDINQPITPKFGWPTGIASNLLVLTNLPSGCVTPRAESGGMSVRWLAPPIGRDILLVALHLPSKLHQTPTEQALNSTRVARDISTEEQRVGHKRTIVVGDLNMNPFEDGVVGAEGLHAVMCQDTARAGARKVGGEYRDFFYNPMWSHFGDRSPGPPGTYFRPGSGQIAFFWSIFDQVLVRPELLDCFLDDSVIILTSVGSTSLLNASGRPDRRVASDHLPVLFELHLD